jgi:NTE family protein
MVKYLVIGPGAMGYFTFLGALTKLKQTGQLDELEEISGASAGALLACLFCATKGDTTKVLDYSIDVPVKQIMKPNLTSFLKNYGLVSNTKLKKVFQGTFQRLMGREDVTFQELWEWYPIKVHVSSYCVDSMKTVYFSVDATPTMSVLDALCATVAVPFLISSVKLKDWNYIDGGTVETTPGGPFLGRPIEGVLVLALAYTHFPEIKDLRTYAMRMLYSTMALRHVYEYPTVRLECEEAFDFGMSQEVKLRLFLSGFSQGLLTT